MGWVSRDSSRVDDNDIATKAWCSVVLLMVRFANDDRECVGISFANQLLPDLSNKGAHCS
jgi:hypothetical protein